MKIVIIGSGNVATTLGSLAQKAGHEICQVFSRTLAHASILASKLLTKAVSDLKELDKTANLYLVAVNDDALQTVSSTLRLNEQLVAHTAGSVPKKVLEPVSRNFGVIYPLQSLRKENARQLSIPILIDANTPKGLSTLNDFANSITTVVVKMDDDQRQKLHLAATLTNNFSNYLYVLAADYCRKENLDFNLLLPIINETSHRLNFFSPEQMQTGPAIRKDKATIDRHLQQLQQYPEIKSVYELFTGMIRDHYK